MNENKYNNSKIKGDLKEYASMAAALREDASKPSDVSAIDLLMRKYGPESQGGNGTVDSLSALLEELGIETQHDTFSGLLTNQTEDIKWLVPEIVWSKIRVGLRRSPIYPNIIAREEPINSLKVQVPWMNMADAAPRWVGEGETIELGSISYASKEFKIRKMGRGIKVTDEVMSYSSINIVNIFFEDFGVKLGYGLDSIAVDVLLNGEQADGSESAPVVGVTTVGAITYRDLLRVWIRMSRMGKNPSAQVGGESVALDILDLDEYKKSNKTAAPEQRLNLRTPVPTETDFYVHEHVNENQVVILDPRTAMAKFNAKPLKIEFERIVSNQTEASYATLTTGFAILFRDSRVVVDKTLNFEDAGFPQYMNIDAMALETIK